MILVEPDADVRRQPAAHAPVVVEEHRVRPEARAFALLRDRVPLDGRRAVAEEDREEVVFAGAAAA